MEVNQMTQIVVGVDGSEGAREALEAAIDLAKAKGASLTTVYVRHSAPSFVGSPYEQRTTSSELRRARTVLAEAEATAAESGVAVETEELEGDPAEQIIDLARLRNAELIVVGSRGLGAMAGVLLGSVSSKVVHHAGRPVLVARRPSA
jgi:nucleotide-binding universal stress UspA family protein